LPIDAYAPDGSSVVDKGKVLVINNQVDPTTGTVQLKAEFPNPDLQLWPGQFVNVRVLINTLHQVVVVPTAATQRGPNGVYVYVVKDDETVTVRPVTLSQQDDTQSVVATGLTAGEKVVTTGFARLAEGTPVQVSSAEAAGQVGGQKDGKQRRGRNRTGSSGSGKGAGKGQRAQQSSGGSTGTQP
jgi:multidrug efflux system membrane fusion protein